MIRRIARKEFTEMARDGRFRAGSIVVFLLLISSFVIGWKHSREMRAHQELAQRSARRQWESQDAKNPHSAAHFGTYAFKTPSPLAYFDRGVDAYTGIAVWVEAHKQNPFLFRPAEDATGIARFGDGAAASALQSLIRPALRRALGPVRKTESDPQSACACRAAKRVTPVFSRDGWNRFCAA